MRQRIQLEEMSENILAKENMLDIHVSTSYDSRLPS